MHHTTKTWGILAFFLVVFFPLYLYTTDLQNITYFGSETNVFLHGLRHLENTIRQGLLFKATPTNHCQHALKCLSITTNLTVCEYVGRIHCAILCDTTQDSQGKKTQTTMPEKLYPVMICFPVTMNQM